METITKIITHPGGAHKDEVLACSILLARHQVRIERRDPSEEELDDASICIVDIGHRHEPAKSNFDHHQFPRDHVPTCSLSLILQDMGLYEEAREFCDWLEPAEWFDCRGPGATADWLGVPRSVVNQLNSPIDVTFLRRFAQATELNPGDPLWEWLKIIGEDLLAYIQNLHDRLAFIEEHSAVWELEAEGVPFKVLFLERTDPLPEEPSFGTERYVERKGWAQDIVGLVYPDRRGSGYGLSRYRDHPQLDFTRITDAEGVHFAHARGFVAKTSHTDPKVLAELVIQAWHPGDAGEHEI